MKLIIISFFLLLLFNETLQQIPFFPGVNPGVLPPIDFIGK